MSEPDVHYRWLDSDLTLQLRITPRSSKNQVLGLMGDRLKIAITAPPVDGKANAHLLKFLSRQFGVPKSHVTLISGMTGRDKTVRIASLGTIPSEYLVDGVD